MRFLIYLFAIGTLLRLVGCDPQRPDVPLQADWTGTLKMDSAAQNPLVDFQYMGDPTAIEYDGRLYVYATNDQEQVDATSPDSAFSVTKVNSIVMLSTRDMVNWTFHGTIPVREVAPWVTSAADPSVCARAEADGRTHFYLYFSDGTSGTAVLTSTSPVGPWTSPLDHDLIQADPQLLRDCRNPISPAVAIDAEGTGWLAFGTLRPKLVRLAKDMISLDGPFVSLPAQHHLAANELSIIGSQMLYSYAVDWTAQQTWKSNYVPAPYSAYGPLTSAKSSTGKPGSSASAKSGSSAKPSSAKSGSSAKSSNAKKGTSSASKSSTAAKGTSSSTKTSATKPTGASAKSSAKPSFGSKSTPAVNAPANGSMVYMMLEGDMMKYSSWKYKQFFTRTPSERLQCSPHTRLVRYEGRWYAIGHTLDLACHRGIKGAFRNLAIAAVEISESSPSFPLVQFTSRGIDQLRTVSPYAQQEAENTAGTQNVRFLPTETPGNVVAVSDTIGMIMLRSVLFNRTAETFVVTSSGSGQVDLRLDNPMGQLVASTYVETDSLVETKAYVIEAPLGIHDVVLLFKGKDLKVDKWHLK